MAMHSPFFKQALELYSQHHYRQAWSAFEIGLNAGHDWHPLAFELAMTAMFLHRPALARPFFEWIICHPPDFLEERLLQSLMFLGYICGQQSEPEAASHYYQMALQIRPQGWLRIRLATMLPLVYENTAQILQWRDKMTQQVKSLLQQPTVDELFFEGVISSTSFHMTYQGLNDRVLQAQIAALYNRYLQAYSLALPPRREAPIPLRICLVSKYFFDHSVLHCFKGLIEALAQSEMFYLTLAICPGCKQDQAFQNISAQAQNMIHLVGNLQEDAQAILNTESAVIVYPELGMDPHTYMLAFFQLAPIRCVLAGHPVTSGIPGMDYFLSSALLEPPNAQSHYSETLVTLPGLLVKYTRPPLPEPWPSRTEIGLPPIGNIYLCPMAPFKFHPSFDPVLVGLLEQDPQGFLVLFESVTHPNLHQLLQARLLAQLSPDAAARVVFLPWASSERFLALLHHATVVLDTYPFGGGNTSYLALSVGTPMVTWPGEFSRGRTTLALYQQMNLRDCVVDSARAYIAKVLHIAQNPDYRKRLQQEIVARQPLIFERTEGIKAALEWLAQQARKVILPSC